MAGRGGLLRSSDREASDLVEDLDDDELHDLLYEAENEDFKRAILHELARRAGVRRRTGCSPFGAIVVIVVVLAGAVATIFMVAF